jgi:hypothetical protein
VLGEAFPARNTHADGSLSATKAESGASIADDRPTVLELDTRRIHSKRSEVAQRKQPQQSGRCPGCRLGVVVVVAAAAGEAGAPLSRRWLARGRGTEGSVTVDGRSEVP